MVAAEVAVPSDKIVAACLARGLLVNNVQPTAVRFVPPLIATRADVDRAMELFGAALRDVAAAQAAAPTPAHTAG
jgi:4-aminobutyrate aminotransferase-like enzyme